MGQELTDKAIESTRKITKPIEKSTKKAVKKDNKTSALQLKLWNSGAFNGVIDKRTGKQVTYERAVDGMMGGMTEQAIQNALNTRVESKHMTRVTPYNQKKEINKAQNKSSVKKQQSLKERYWSLNSNDRSNWRGENMNTYANTPEYRAEFDRYSPSKTETGSTVYRSRLGDLGLVSNNDGTYSLYDKNGKLIDRCAQTTNALQEMLQKHQNTIGDAWTSHGMYGDSMLVNGYKYLPKIGGYNKFTHTAQNLLAATAVQSQLNNLDLQTGDVVGLYSANSDYNDKAWSEGTRNRSNSHEGIIFKPNKAKNQTYIIHNINGKVFVDPMSKFMVSESGLQLDWAPTYVMRPNSGPSRNQNQQEQKSLTYNASKDGKNFFDFLTVEGKKKYGLDINKEYILVDNKPKEI